MEFTSKEKRMIVSALEAEWGELTDAVNKITHAWELGIRFEGESLEGAIQVFSGFQHYLDIEKKIFESLDDGEEKHNLLEEINQNISQFNKCKEIVGFFKDDGQPETDDSDGVLGDKAQD